MLPQTLLVVATSLFRARGRVIGILTCSLVTALLNLVGDFALSFGWWGFPEMGPSGIGAATLYSSIVGCAMALAISWQGRAGEAGELERAFIPNGPIIRNILSIGWPAGALQLGWNFASLIIFAILGKLEDGGVAATAAITNGLRIEAGLFMPVFALNMAAGVLVGQALGNRDVTGAKRAGWRVSWAAVVVITLASLPIFVFSRELGALLSPDPNVIEATHLYLRINMLSQPFMALSLCLGGGLQGAGDTHGVSKVVLASLYGVRLPLALALAFGAGWGANGVWLAMTGSMVIQGVWMSARFKRGEWTSKEFAA